MASKRYYWLKLGEDFFRGKEIKKLRQIAGGDTYTIIYLKLLLRSLQNDGKLYFEGVEEDFASEMALDVDESPENVAVTVQFLLTRGILQRNTDAEYELVTAALMTGSEGDSARRVREFRQRQTLQSNALALQSNSDVTNRNIEIELELEKERRDRERVKAAKPPRAARFTPPTLDEVRSYCLERGNSVDPERFVDFYESKGWMVGNSKMRDWKAAVRGWEKRDGAKPAAMRQINTDADYLEGWD